MIHNSQKLIINFIFYLFSFLIQIAKAEEEKKAAEETKPAEEATEKPAEEKKE